MADVCQDSPASERHCQDGGNGLTGSGDPSYHSPRNGTTASLNPRMNTFVESFRLRARTPAAYALVLTLLAMATWWHGLDSQFIGDDSRITSMEGFLRKGYQESLAVILPDRPLLVMTILLNYSLGGLDPWGYKALSLAFHIAVGLVFFIFLLTMQKRFSTSTHPLAPALTAAIFLVHPLNSQALLSSIQRGVIMAALGGIASLLAFVAYLSSRRKVFILLSLLFYVLGILSKSFLITLPCMFLLYLFLVERKVRPNALTLAPFFAASLLPVIPYVLFGVNRQSGDLLWHEYLFVQTRVVWTYFRLFVAPANLHFFYEFAADPAILANFTWLAIAGHLTILGTGVFLSRRKPFVAFGIFAMYLAFVPESSVFAIDHPAFEHRTYFPMLFFLFTLFAAARSLPTLPASLAAVPVAVIALFAVQTNVRIGEIDTHEKWVLNTYRYQTHNRWNNIWLLDELCGMDLNARGLGISRGMIARDPGFPPYQLYQRLFQFPTASLPQQRETVELVSLALLNPAPWLRDDKAMVSRFLGFIVDNSRRFSDSPLAYRKNLERVFRNHVPLFFRSPNSFTIIMNVHKTILTELGGHYERELRGKGIEDAEFVQYLNILGQWALYEPRSPAGLEAVAERLARDYPQRSGLIGIARAYYRDLQTVLKR